MVDELMLMAGLFMMMLYLYTLIEEISDDIDPNGNPSQHRPLYLTSLRFDLTYRFSSRFSLEAHSSSAERYLQSMSPQPGPLKFDTILILALHYRAGRIGVYIVHTAHLILPSCKLY